MDSTKPVYLEAKSVNDIKLGDLIQLSRAYGLYAHWAVYVGFGDVIHISPPPSMYQNMDFSSALGPHIGFPDPRVQPWPFKLLDDNSYIKVRRDPLGIVAAGSAVVVNNECDNEMRPFPGEVIVRRAESKLGTNGYNLLTWNCEHFATWCRYDKAVSKQVDSLFDILSVNAYLVQLPGAELIPPGTLPINIYGIGIPVEDLLSPWAKDRQRTIKGLKALAEKMEKNASKAKTASTYGRRIGAISGIGAAVCYLAAPFTFGLSLVPAEVLTVSFFAGNVVAGTASYVSIKAIANDCIKDVQTAIDADRDSFGKLKGCVRIARGVPSKEMSSEDVNEGCVRIARGVQSKEMSSEDVNEGCVRIARGVQSKEMSSEDVNEGCVRIARGVQSKEMSSGDVNEGRVRIARGVPSKEMSSEDVNEGRVRIARGVQSKEMSSGDVNEGRVRIARGVQSKEMSSGDVNEGRVRIARGVPSKEMSSGDVNEGRVRIVRGVQSKEMSSGDVNEGRVRIVRGVQSKEMSSGDVNEGRVRIVRGVQSKEMSSGDAKECRHKEVTRGEMFSMPATQAFSSTNEVIVTKNNVAAKLIRLAQIANFADPTNAIAVPTNIDAFVKDASAEGNLSEAADKVLKLAIKLEQEYDDIMLEDKDVK